MFVNDGVEEVVAEGAGNDQKSEAKRQQPRVEFAGERLAKTRGLRRQCARDRVVLAPRIGVALCLDVRAARVLQG